jgi:ribosomal protein S18 acetylase RimI-like enzyme/predicted nucleic acid-binding protein
MTPSLPPSASLISTGRIALDTSCVLNLLSVKEQPDPDLLRLMRYAHEGRTRLTVTPIVEAEVPPASVGGSDEAERDRTFIRQRIKMFAVDEITPGREKERDTLAGSFLALLWPNIDPGSRNHGHSFRDCQHLASLRLCGSGVFVSLDDGLTRKAQSHRDVLGIDVLHPRDVVPSFVEPEADGGQKHDQIVRPARQDDADAISMLMAPIKSSYPEFDRWREKALREKRAYVGVIDDAIAGIAVWAPKDDRVVKLSTFYVGDDHRGRGLGPYLLFNQLRLWVEQRVEKVVLTVSSERINALRFFLDYGFRIEGASPRRYKEGVTEFVLSKHLFYERVTEADLDAFLERLSREVLSLPPEEHVQGHENWFMPPVQQQLRPRRTTEGRLVGVDVLVDGRRVREHDLNTLEEIVYPARLAVAGREAFMIPIKPTWAEALMEIPRDQVSMFANTDKLRLRTDNAYYCHPRIGPERLKGSPMLFYVSAPDMVVAGFARILVSVQPSPRV